MKKYVFNLMFIISMVMVMIPESFAEMFILPRGMGAAGNNTQVHITPADPVVYTYGVVFQAQCYGTNNRGTKNPIAPDSVITSHVKVGAHNFSVRYKGTLTKPFGPKQVSAKTRFVQVIEGTRASFCKQSYNFDLCQHLSGWEDRGFIANSLQSYKRNVLDFSGLGNSKKDKELKASIFKIYKELIGDKRFIETREPLKQYGQIVKDLDGNIVYVHIPHKNLPVLLGETYVKAERIATAQCKESDNATRETFNATETNCVKERLCATACAFSGSVSCRSSCKTGMSLKIVNEAVVAANVTEKLQKSTTKNCYIYKGVADNSTPLSSFTPVACGSQYVLTDSIQLNMDEDDHVSVRHFQQTNRTKRIPFYAFTGVIPDGKNYVTKLSANQIKVRVTFPGQDGYCGGYHSPIMFFFGDKMPLFTSEGELLRKELDGKTTYWPEENHHGYFLVRLDGKKKEVTKANQLFGNIGQFSNGFEALEFYDDNQDGKITRKDKVFKHLYLWKDKNSNGKSEKNELIKITRKGIFKIDIHKFYDRSYYLDFNNRAKARGKSLFFYSDGKKIKRGSVVDIFLMEK